MPAPPSEAAHAELIAARRAAAQRDPDSATAACELALALQSSDLAHHVGGQLQEEALAAFQRGNALGFEGREAASAASRCLCGMGILLTTMSRAEESVDVLTEAEAVAATVRASHGRAYFLMRARYHRAQARLMLGGRAQLALALGDFERSLADAQDGRDAGDPGGWIASSSYTRGYQGIADVLSEDAAAAALQERPGGAAPWTWAALRAAAEAEAEAREKALGELLSTLPDLTAGFARAGLSGVLHASPAALASDAHAAALGPSVGQLSELSFCLFKCYEKLDEPQSAFKYLTRANQLESARQPAWDAALAKAGAVEYQTVFQKSFWPPGVGASDKTPIFIVGMMRSGSSLVEQILSSHPDVAGMGEDSVFNGRLPQVRDAIVRAVSATAAAGSLRPLVDAVEAHSRGIAEAMHAKLAPAERLNTATGKRVARIVDKMLFNYRNIGFIHLVFPNATIVHTERDPMDTLFSAFTQRFDDTGLAWANSLESLAEAYRIYRDLMAHWEKVLPGRIHTVRYEEMVADQEGQSRKLLAACGLKWDPAVLEFHNKSRAVHTHSQSQVRRKIYTSAVKRWRKYEEELAPLRRALGDFAAEAPGAGTGAAAAAAGWDHRADL